MANHSFDVDIAVEYGVHAAILLNYFYFWVQKNKANESNFHDGCYWTYNSRKAYAELFPYMSAHQIKATINKLVESGLIKIGCFNKDSRDRTLWYTLTENGYCKVQKCQMQVSEMANASGENGQPLPVNKTTNKDNIYIAGFNAFYSAYPRHIDKRPAFDQWKKLKPDKALQDRIISDVQHRIDGEWKGREERFIPYPSKYLKHRPWEDEPIEQPKPQQTQDELDDEKGPFGRFY